MTLYTRLELQLVPLRQLDKNFDTTINNKVLTPPREKNNWWFPSYTIEMIPFAELAKVRERLAMASLSQTLTTV